MFSFEETKLAGVVLITPYVARDERGLFIKTYQGSEFGRYGICQMGNEEFYSLSRKNVIRGLHFQVKNQQDKLVRVLSGRAWDVVVDLRKDSETFGQWESFALSADNQKGLYIPKGFAHGFLALTEDVLFAYRCGNEFDRTSDSGIVWNDEELGIEWPVSDVSKVILSKKDASLQTFAEFKNTIGGL